MTDVAIGIDLGTSNSCVAVVVDGTPSVIANAAGERTHASVVQFLDDGKVIVGNEAKRTLLANVGRPQVLARPCCRTSAARNDPLRAPPAERPTHH